MIVNVLIFILNLWLDHYSRWIWQTARLLYIQCLHLYHSSCCSIIHAVEL